MADRNTIFEAINGAIPPGTGMRMGHVDQITQAVLDVLEGIPPGTDPVASVLAGYLNHTLIGRRITFRHMSSGGLDTTIHGTPLVGYSVNEDDVRLYVAAEDGTRLPVLVPFDCTIHIDPELRDPF